MNLTLVIAIACLLLWALLLFAFHVQSGAINLLYAVAALAVARRIIVGAPTFRS